MSPFRMKPENATRKTRRAAQDFFVGSLLNSGVEYHDVVSVTRTYRAGSAVEDYCRACKTDRMHTVVAADQAAQPIRTRCGYCGSEHNFRGGPRVEVSG